MLTMVSFLLFSMKLFSNKTIMFWLFFLLLMLFLFNHLSVWNFMFKINSLSMMKNLKILFVLLSVVVLMLLMFCFSNRTYESWFIMLSVLKMMFFLSNNLVTLYVFFELSMIPIFILSAVYKYMKII